MLWDRSVHFIIIVLIYGINGNTPWNEYIGGDDGLETHSSEVMDGDDDFILLGSDDVFDPDVETNTVPRDTSDVDIVDSVISEIQGLPDQPNNNEEENTWAEIDLARKLLEMEEADDSSSVHVFSLENGMIKEEELPGGPIEDEEDSDEVVDDISLSDDEPEVDMEEADDSDFLIEASLTSQSRMVDLGYAGDITADKRSNRGKTATVDILAIVDNSLYRKFLSRHKYDKLKTMMDIRKYYTIVVAMANERYSTIRVPGMRIQLVLSNIIVSKDRADSPWVENIVQFKNRKPVVSAITALAKLHKWLVANKDLPHYDHAIAFTSYKMLVHRHTPAAGVAQLSGMCNTALGVSSSVIVDIADYRSAHVIAHELGHSLGASHDGRGKNRRCPVTNSYVMSPKAVYAKNTFKNIYTFSTCSLSQMRSFLSSPAAKCLYDKATPMAEYDVKKTPPGRMFSADVQCKMVFGKKSGLCQEPSLQTSVCERLWCMHPEDKNRCQTNDLLFALPGTSCGVNKHCYRLECVMTQSVLPQAVKSRMRSPNLTSPPPGQKSSQSRTGRYQGRQRARYRSLKGVCRDRKVRQCDAVIRAKPSICKRRRVQRSCCQACRRYYRQ